MSRAACVVLNLAIGLLTAACLFAQSPADESPAAQAQSPEAAPARVIDVEAARRAKQQEHSFKASDIPIGPFRFVGKGMEKGLVAVDQHHLIDRARYYQTEHAHGFMPVFGHLGCRDRSGAQSGPGQSLLLPGCPTAGTGFTLGVKYYRNNFLRPGGELDIPVRVSSLLYQEYGVNFSLPLDSSQRIFLDAGSSYRVRTQDDFYGLGNDSKVANRTSYMLQTREFFLGPRFQLARKWRLALQGGYTGTNVFNGKDTYHYVITALFRRSEIPGLQDGAREWVAGGEFVYDSRQGPGPRRGGYHRFAANWHRSADANDFGFWRYEVEAERYVPLGSRNRTLALRFLGITNQARGGSQVPFFEQVILGGSSTLRGFREFRFYDKSGLLGTAEYRYNLNAFTDVVLFADEGQVAPHPGDFSWRGFRTSYGAGFRFLTAQSVPFKILFGRSNEGTRIYFSLGGSF